MRDTSQLLQDEHLW